jgi:F5/8 type C domain/Alpha-L-fucosidase
MRFERMYFTVVLFAGLLATGCSMTTTEPGKAESKPSVVEATSGQPSGYVPRYSDAFKMKYGLFIHWVGTSPVQGSGAKRPDGTPYLPGSINEFANDINVEAVADEMKALGFEYVLITDFHGFGTMLHPSAVSDRWRGPGYASDRDVMGEMIAALKKRGIGFILFTHPLCGHIYADKEKLGWDDPTGGYKKWNDFVNDVYAELTDRYGKDIMGFGFDSDFGLSPDTNFVGKLDHARLRETILSRAPTLQLYSLPGPVLATEFGHKEVWRADWHDPWRSRGTNDYDVETWPSYRRKVSVVVPNHWVTIAAASQGMTHLNADQLYRYTVIQSATATDGPGNAWAASPYPDGSWENNVREVFAAVADYMAPVRESLTRVYVSTSYPIPEGSQLASLKHGIAATRALDDSVEYIHVLTPPASKILTLPAPADGKKFVSAKLLASGKEVQLIAGENGEVAIDIGSEEWHKLNTVIALTVDPATIPARSLALYKQVSASDNRFTPQWPKPSQHGLLWLVDGIRHYREKEQVWLQPNAGWSSEPRSTPGSTWVSVDLADTFAINEVRLYPRDDAGHEGEGCPIDLSVEVSLDGEKWKTVASRTGIPQSKEPLVLNFDAVKARHVRVVGTTLRQNPTDGLYSMQFVELEVFGDS